MHQINTKLFFYAFATLVACNVSYAEEVVYLQSSDPCLVDAYSAPEATSPLPEKLDCGEKVSILERRGPIVRIKLGEGQIVWVVAKDTTQEVPAELEVLRLMDYQKKIEGELAALNSKVRALSETSEKLINALIAAEAAKK